MAPAVQGAMAGREPWGAMAGRVPRGAMAGWEPRGALGRHGGEASVALDTMN